MANPNGGNLIADAGYVWTDGDVYEISQLDTCEGAATGASFSGLGIHNKPHLILLNKIQYTHGKQIADEANITALLAFMAEFACSMGPVGWKKTPMQDSVRGAIVVIEQWGVFKPAGGLANDHQYDITFPIPFPN